MPTDAFLNLEEEKKNKLLNSAMKEFSILPYEKVSVFKIAQNAEISRSAFYYYFKDKRDIYHYLLSQIKHSFVRELSKTEKQYDIFDFSCKLFELITRLKGTDKEAFLRQVISNMKPEDTKYFFDKIEICTASRHVQFLHGMEGLKISTKEELTGLVCLVLASTVHALQWYFIGGESLSAAQKQLERMFEMIKYGILQENKRGNQEEIC